MQIDRQAITDTRPTIVSRLQRVVTPSLADAMFILCIVTALTMGGALANRDGDLGRHLTLGREILDTGSIPVVDVYSFTSAGGSMVPHEWLAQALFAGVHRWWGFDGVGLLAAVAVALPWAIMTRVLLSRALRASAVLPTVLLGAAASAIHWVTRPHVFTFVFVALWVVVLGDLRAGRRRHVWLLIPFTVVWANLHGAFIIGFVVILTYLVGAVLDRRLGHDNHVPIGHLSLVLGGSVTASLINPVGIKLISNSFAYLGDDFLLEFTNEYTSPDFHLWPFWPFAALLFAGMLIRWQKSPTNVLLFVSWAAFGLYSFRNIPIFALVVTPMLAAGLDGHLAELGNRLRHRLPDRWFDPSWRVLHRTAVGGVASAVVLGLLLVSLVRSPGTAYGFSPDVFPVAAMGELGNDPPGERVFNQFEWGGYLLDCCWPQIEVFIDGQTDYYGPALTRQYDTAVNGAPGWQEVLETYGVDWVLVDVERPLAQLLAESSDWVERYRDDVAVVFVPRP